MLYPFHQKKKKKSKEMKLEESVVVNEISNGLDVGINLNRDESAKGKKLKEILPEIGGESQKDDEVSKEMKLDEIVQPVEKSVHVDVEMIPKASIEVGISSLSSNEKEVPLTTEEINVNEDADDNVEVVHLENGSEVDGDSSMEREFQKDEVLKEEKLGAPHIPVIHKSREEIGSFQQGLPQVDKNSNDKTMEKSIDESSIPVENSVIAIEEPSQGSKVYNESVISASDDSFHGKTKTDADKTEIAHQHEVVRGPLVVCRAMPWNCCGLLEFLRSSDR